MQEPTEMTKVQIKDELGATIEKGQIESLERESEQYKKAIEQKIKEKEDFTRQVLVAKRVRELQINNLKKVPEHIVWEYEKIPEFWELQTKLLSDKHRQENHMDDAKLKRYDFEIEDLNKRLAETQDALVKITTQ
jgi:poly-gamma-glutamate capsule biosynthesis protein CapA/YwtB (metallophosphatase superfamily)